MFLQFKGKQAQLFNDNKQIVRKFNVSNEIINAQVTGTGNSATVALTMKNGKTWLFKANGQLIRR